MDIYKLSSSAEWDEEDPLDPIVQSTKVMQVINKNFENELTDHLAQIGALYVAEEQGVIKGVAQFEPLAHLDFPVAWLHYLAVHPEYQGGGIGSDMINHFSRFCLRARIRELYAYPTADSISFYEQHGFYVQRVSGVGPRAVKEIK